MQRHLPSIQELLQPNACKLESSHKKYRGRPPTHATKAQLRNGKTKNKMCIYIYIYIHLSFCPNELSIIFIMHPPRNQHRPWRFQKNEHEWTISNWDVDSFRPTVSLKNLLPLRRWEATQICTFLGGFFYLPTISNPWDRDLGISGRWAHGWKVWKARRTKPMAHPFVGCW